MMSTMSTLSRKGSITLKGWSALRTTPQCLPFDLMMSRALRGSLLASGWKVTISAPLSQNSPTYFSGSVIIRCTSKNISLFLRSALTMGMPKVMLGTYTPSITSQCTQSAPQTLRSLTASAIFPKSADKMLGATKTLLIFVFSPFGEFIVDKFVSIISALSNLFANVRLDSAFRLVYVGASVEFALRSKHL